MLPRPTVPALAAAALVLAAGAAPAGAASGGTTASTAAPSSKAPAKGSTSKGSTAKGSTSKAGTRAVRPSSSATIKLASSSRVTARKDVDRGGRAGTLRNKEKVRVSCQVNSRTAVSSRSYGTSKVWNRVKLRNGRTGYVPDVYMQTSSKDSLVAPLCGFPDPPAPGATNPGQGRCASVSPIALDAVPADRATFVRTAGPFAQQSKATTGVPAAVTLAQGILESGSGQFTAGANNYFGIKAQLLAPGTFSWGPTAVGCIHKQTNEVEKGRTVRQIASFRLYAGMKQSFDDHGNFLRINSRYAPAFAVADDPEAFAKAIAKAGYATDPQYPSKLIGLMNDPALPLKGYDG